MPCRKTGSSGFRKRDLLMTLGYIEITYSVFRTPESTGTLRVLFEGLNLRLGRTSHAVS